LIGEAGKVIGPQALSSGPQVNPQVTPKPVVLFITRVFIFGRFDLLHHPVKVAFK